MFRSLVRGDDTSADSAASSLKGAPRRRFAQEDGTTSSFGHVIRWRSTILTPSDLSSDRPDGPCGHFAM